MSRLPLLPRWVLPSVASIYDVESATISEMVPKLYGTMRDMVNNYNEFADELNEEIRNFTGSTSEEIANFKQSIEERLRCKFNDLDADLAKIRLDMKQHTDTTLSRAFDVFGVTVKATGEDIILTDATDEEIRALSLYGKTTQRWIPVPEYPADLQSVGDAGSVTVEIRNGSGELQQLTIATPEGLPGIPVSDGGNYTDATGQHWICDEIDLKRSVYIKRINRFSITSTDNGKVIGNTIRFSLKLPVASEGIKNAMCSHLPYEYSYGNDTPHFYTDGGFAWMFLPISSGTTAAEVTAWLTKNPVDILYQLAEPVERPLTAAELAAYKKLHTYMPDTTVTTDAGAGILLEYVAIVQNFVDNIIPVYAADVINEHIRNGTLVVSSVYDPDTESLDIIAGGV